MRGCSADPPVPPGGAGGSGASGSGTGRGQTTHTPGRTGGCQSLPRGHMLEQKVGGHQGDPRTPPRLPAANRGTPKPPPPLRPTSESQALALWASHSPSPTPFSLEGQALRLPRGLGVEAGGVAGRKRAAPPPGGEGSASLRRARPGCPALDVHFLSQGRPEPAALCPWGPPFQQQSGAVGRACGF